MQIEMAYLLGMYYGNGKFQDDGINTTFFIEIPYKTLKVDNLDVEIYVSASVNDLKNYLQPLLGISLIDTRQNNKTILSFTKNNREYFTKEFKDYIGNVSACECIRVTQLIKDFTVDEKKNFLKGFADATGYIRDSNRFMGKEGYNRVYLEVPRNWFLVVDICNLLRDVDVPVQTIDWAHPNMRDGNLKKYNQGNQNFWKKEHQIKIYAQEFSPIGFTIKHKEQKLLRAITENREIQDPEEIINNHRFYWEKSSRPKTRLNHPGENDLFIPEIIRGKHFESWQDIAIELGYKK